jgi:hypothetical protein
MYRLAVNYYFTTHLPCFANKWLVKNPGELVYMAGPKTQSEKAKVVKRRVSFHYQHFTGGYHCLNLPVNREE